MTAKEKVKPNSSKIDLKKNITEEIMDRFDNIRHNPGRFTTGELRLSMQQIMQQNCSVFRTQELLFKGINKLNEVESSMNDLEVRDKSLIFNTDLTEALELNNLMAQSKVTLHSALNRKESRVTLDCAIRLFNSNASVKSVLKINDLSLTSKSFIDDSTSLSLFIPLKRSSCVLKTEQFCCIICCIDKRSSPVVNLPGL
jgi:aspartate oxidase